MLEIKFYRVREPYGRFSNFSRDPITIDGLLWPSSEHFYQAHKSLDPAVIETIRNLATPREAADIGRAVDLRPDWHSLLGDGFLQQTGFTDPGVPSVKLVKDYFMWRALVNKFTQHTDLMDLLLSTGDAILIEHTKNDRYWGDNGDGTGLNCLGRQLMDLRDILK